MVPGTFEIVPQSLMVPGEPSTVPQEGAVLPGSEVPGPGPLTSQHPGPAWRTPPTAPEQGKA